MRIQRLAGDKQAHDLAGTFEDGVDAAVAEKPFHGFRLLASSTERISSFITPPTANLHGVVNDLPGGFCSPELAQGGFQPHIGVLVLVYETRRVTSHGLH